MKKSMLFSLALCVGLLLPQDSFTSQSWSEWGMQGLRNAAQTAYNYVPSASSLSNWATNLVSGMSEEQKNSLRTALGMSAAFAAAGAAGYYYTQRQQELAQEVERLRKELELDKGSTSTAETVGKIAFFYQSGRESVQDKALEQIFKEDICRSLETLPVSPTVFIADVISQVKKSFPTHAWAVSFDMQLLKSLKSLLEKTACNAESLISAVNARITNMTEKQTEQESLLRFEHKIKQEQAGVVKRSAQWVSEAPPTSVPFVAEKEVKPELSPEQFEAKVVEAQKNIEDMMQQVGERETNSGADGTAIVIAVIATIIGNCGAEKSKLQNAALERYFKENLCHVFNIKEFNDERFVEDFVNTVVGKTNALYRQIPVKNILQVFRNLLFKGSCDNTKGLLKYLEKVIKQVQSAQ